jgi:hypothetical protein
VPTEALGRLTVMAVVMGNIFSVLREGNKFLVGMPLIHLTILPCKAVAVATMLAIGTSGKPHTPRSPA